MTIKDYNKYFPLKLAPEVVYAGQFLEDRGLVFGSDYTSPRALAMATEMLMIELEHSMGGK
jgi:hypothetical protein